MTRETAGERAVRQSVVTTGTFDGVHLGHQAIIGYLVERAREIGGVPTVVTFDPHPREVLLGRPIPLLTTLAERADLLEALGVERFVVVGFSRDLSLLEPDAYVRDVLVEGVGDARDRDRLRPPLRAEGGRRPRAAGEARPVARLLRRRDPRADRR